MPDSDSNIILEDCNKNIVLLNPEILKKKNSNVFLFPMPEKVRSLFPSCSPIALSQICKSCDCEVFVKKVQYIVRVDILH